MTMSLSKVVDIICSLVTTVINDQKFSLFSVMFATSIDLLIFLRHKDVFMKIAGFLGMFWVLITAYLQSFNCILDLQDLYYL